MRVLLRKQVNLIIILCSLVPFYGCEKNEDDSNNKFNDKTTAVFNSNKTYGTMTDQEGNVYKTITIGTQTWMAENLRTTKYNDNTEIPNVTDNLAWNNLSTGAYCTYNNTTDIVSIATYGRIYNWYAVNYGKLAPSGWHVPSKTEWTTLINYLGGESVAGAKIKEAGTNHWKTPNTGTSNESGLTVLPGGYRYDFSGIFTGINDGIGFWSSTDDPNTNSNAWIFQFSYNNSYAISNTALEFGGFYIRLIKDTK